MMYSFDTQNEDYPVPLTNLPKQLPYAIKSYLDNQQSKDLYLVLDYRNGFTKKRPLTLEEIGALLRVSGERVRQKENKAFERLKEGLFSIPLIDLDIELNLLYEIKALGQIIKSMPLYVEEQVLLDIIASRYQYTLNRSEISHLHVLFIAYGFEQINLSNCRPFWQSQKGKYTQEDLARLNKHCQKILHEEALPLSYTDLLISLAKYDRSILLDDDTTRLVLNVNEKIETLAKDYYQIFFEHLSGAPDMAYRVLSEQNEEPLHSDDIAKEINQRLVKAGKKSITKGDHSQRNESVP